MVFIFSLSILVVDLFLHPAGQLALSWLLQNAGRAFLLLANEHCSFLSFVAAMVEIAKTDLSPLSMGAEEQKVPRCSWWSCSDVVETSWAMKVCDAGGLRAPSSCVLAVCSSGLAWDGVQESRHSGQGQCAKTAYSIPTLTWSHLC